MKYASEEFQAMLDRFFIATDDVRKSIPLLSRDRLSKELEQFSMFIDVGERARHYMRVAMEAVDYPDDFPKHWHAVAGFHTPPNTYSKKDIMLGLYFLNWEASTVEALRAPIGAVFLPRDRYILHVEGLVLDTAGLVTAYEPGSMEEDANDLISLGVLYKEVARLVDAFPISDDRVGRRNYRLREWAFKDLKKGLQE